MIIMTALEFIVAIKRPFTVLIVLAFFGVVLWRSPTFGDR